MSIYLNERGVTFFTSVYKCSLTLRHSICAIFTLLLITSLTGCGSVGTRNATHSLSQKTTSIQEDLGPIRGPVTKEKVLDRLKGYPICGMKDEPQKLTLMMRFNLLSSPASKRSGRDETGGVSLAALDAKNRGESNDKGKDVSSVRALYLVEVECFFFAYQGLFEYLILDTSTGVITPIPFDGAIAPKKELKGAEIKSPIAHTDGRFEVCGVPDFDAKKQTLSTLCKGNAQGGCGAYATFKLTGINTDQSTPETKPRFSIRAAHFLSCVSPSNVPPNEWPTIRL